MAEGSVQTTDCDEGTFKNVLLIGTTGHGKTTIANMLGNDSSKAEDCEGPGEVGHGSCAGTRSATLIPIPGSQMIICDTVGLGDPEMLDDEIIETLRTLQHCRNDLTCVVVVSSFNRWSNEERLNFAFLDTILEKGWTKHAVLVLTHYDGEMEDKDSELEQWCKKDHRVQEIVRMFADIILTDNCTSQLYEESTREFRDKCLQELKQAIGKHGERIKFREIDDTVNMLTTGTFFSRWPKWFGKVGGVLSAWKGVIMRPPATQLCGHCEKCSKEITRLEDWRQTGNCKHIFHASCLEGATDDAEETQCPKCSEVIQEVLQAITSITSSPRVPGAVEGSATVQEVEDLSG